MTNDILNSLLRDYERKKLNAELDLERRKDLIYKLIPRLLEIDTELNSLGIQSAKSILFSPEKKDFYLNDLNKKIKDLKDEKEFILIKNGYSKDYFEPFYECKLCNDTGFVTDENFKTSMCSCLKQKLLNISFNKSNMYNLKKENFENFNDSFFSDEVDLSKYKFNISPRKNNQNIKNKSIEFIKNFDNSDSKILLFTGATGLR